MRSVLGSLRLLGQRVREVRQPGLGIYAFAGEQAVRDVSGQIVARATRGARAVREYLAKFKAAAADGEIDAGELRELEAASAKLQTSATGADEITEAAAL